MAANHASDSFGGHHAGDKVKRFTRDRDYALSGECLKECESPDCTTIIFGSGFCVNCEQETAQLLTAEAKDAGAGNRLGSAVR